MMTETARTKRRGFAYLMTLMLLIAHFQAAEWQASGNLEPGQLEFIR